MRSVSTPPKAYATGNKQKQSHEALRYDQPGKPTLMYQRKGYLLLP